MQRSSKDLACLTQKNDTSHLQVSNYYFFRWNLVAMANNAASIVTKRRRDEEPSSDERVKPGGME